MSDFSLCATVSSTGCATSEAILGATRSRFQSDWRKGLIRVLRVLAASRDVEEGAKIKKHVNDAMRARDSQAAAGV